LKEPSQQASKDAIVKKLRITPFAASAAQKKTSGIRFGGESKQEREEAALRVKSLFGKTLLDGPLTDGMLIPPHAGWPGGILDFDPVPPGDPSKARTNWLLGGDRKLDVIIQPETAKTLGPQWPPGEKLVEEVPDMVGIDALIEQTRKSLLHTSSVLLTGGLGSGKTSLVQLLANQLRNEYLFNVIHLSCRTLVTDETRVKTIKDTLHRVFAAASWGARLGGRALVILDDLDKLCPTETELQVDANGRSRQVSEILCTVVREWCGRDSGVVMLATAQAKESLNNVVVGGHVVRDIVALKAPNKDGRRKVLELLIRKSQQWSEENGGPQDSPNKNATDWMESSVSDGGPSSADDGRHVNTESDLDLLTVAGQTDGYMPGDLALLVSRARSEALIRTVANDSLSDEVILMSDDFDAALKGFTPASLRGVTLQSSRTTFSAIGGLKETRQTLLETLQYPTTYAPLFAKCPLRLRSGLLLYGYPGCGKTLLASAVAGECGLNFISVKGPEILNKYIGASEKSVRDLFERAEAAKPCVLFFDEFDSIAPKRGHDSTGVTDRVVNMLLTMMDGAEGLSGVYVLAATSRPDLIDPALLRPGRLDKSLICDMPNAEDRLDILKAVTTQLKLDPAVLHARNGSAQSLEEVARRTDGYSGADLQAVMYNAHLDAIQDVLGADAAANDFGKKKSGDSRSSRANNVDFTVFRAGEIPGGGANGTSASSKQKPTPAALAAERANIAARLNSMQLARRKARVDRHVSSPISTRPSHSFTHLSAANLSLSASANGSISGRSASGASHAGSVTGSASGLRTLSESPNEGNGISGSEEPVILWRHLLKSLETTRASISAQERRRLEKIYREFVVGRNGEMQDGQGPTEIGGRTSLM
jgi:peroxin-1